MNIGLQGQNLIFLISQPRSGSSLLQRILGNHPQVHTISEPWLMLHSLYALRGEGYEAEYRTKSARLGLQDFFQTLPDGEDDYVKGIRRMHAYLYERALSGTGKCRFLDKTPRYYLIIPELYRIFPQARYIILLRNPLAVLCSVYATWVREALLLLYDHARLDLIQAPRLLLEGIRLLGDQGVEVHYEQLVKSPEREIQRLCSNLKIDFEPDMVNYGRHNLPRWQLGDHKVHKHARPIAQIAEGWIETIADPQAWQLAHGYLVLLGQEIVEQMGYSFTELQQILKSHRPRYMRLRCTFSLAWLLKKPAHERTRWERNLVWLTRSLHQQGLGNTAFVMIKKLSGRYWGRKKLE